MGVSEYVKKAEQHDRLSKKEEEFKDMLCVIANGEELGECIRLLEVLKKEYISYAKEEVRRERELWENYNIRLLAWRLDHYQPKTDSDEMQRAMTEPNRPHYYIANNE